MADTKPSKKTRTLHLSVPEGLMQAAELYGRLSQMERSTVLRHWIRQGSERELLQLVSDGQLSTGKLVEWLGISYYDVHDLAQKYGIELGPSDEQIQYMNENYGGKIAEILKASRKAQKE
jgi:hypothetical protein